jgi:hypothetical protein
MGPMGIGEVYGSNGNWGVVGGTDFAAKRCMDLMAIGESLPGGIMPSKCIGTMGIGGGMLRCYKTPSNVRFLRR